MDALPRTSQLSTALERHSRPDGLQERSEGIRRRTGDLKLLLCTYAFHVGGAAAAASTLACRKTEVDRLND